MDDEFTLEAVPALTRAADRLDELADTAELMGDDPSANRFRIEARTQRMRAMDLLDG
jgi:hypothetical protein